LFWLPSLRTYEGSRRWSHDRLPLRLRALRSVEVAQSRQGRRIKAADINWMAANPSAAADFYNKICQKLTSNMLKNPHAANAEFSFKLF